MMLNMIHAIFTSTQKHAFRRKNANKIAQSNTKTRSRHENHISEMPTIDIRLKMQAYSQKQSPEMKYDTLMK